MTSLFYITEKDSKDIPEIMLTSYMFMNKITV